MTCVVGWIEKGRIYMGADSAGVAGLDLRIRKDPKVFKKGPFIIGYTSSFRMGQLIRYKMEIPDHPAKMDPFEFMCVHFVESLRKCLREGGYTKVNNNVEEGGCFLVGYRKRLYLIDSDFQVGVAKENYDAVGCGRDFALGAMRILNGLNIPPIAAVKRALTVAEEFSAGVRRPFIMETL
ncbi:MAG: hypothetical protein HS130_00930 [Deltaproteobacteria bacterium]|nr:hypothetical protein [Deltaproteobacteria bacterium]MCL4873849.1 hypothetical protein [bacterium]